MPIFNPALRLRRAARLIVLDPETRALMFRYDVPGRDPFWVTAGGECEPGESFRKAARRELLEETGIKVFDIGPEVARMTPEFVTVEGELVQAYERFFLVRVDEARVDTSRHTALEQQLMTQHRWFTLDELENWHEAVYPVELAKIIRSAIAT
jgi:8-oxo-dGTP pyrophosphatase MutT (NUDIX family)